MNKLMFPLVLASAALSYQCLAEEARPRTVGATEAGGWYGSEVFATQLPAAGVWPTTAPGARLPRRGMLGDHRPVSRPLQRAAQLDRC
jgi:hypothetical protein